ncbi:hypothetical protein, partial [Bacteroides sp.]|uniref:hypothetical protein n=1 Tax=Bacteroides sp. TaxID=29523 RepID=UPI0025888390
ITLKKATNSYPQEIAGEPLFDLLYRDIIDTSLFAKLLKNSVIPIPSFIRKNNCLGNGILGS